MFIWAYIVAIVIFFIQKILGVLTRRWKRLSEKFNHTRVKAMVFMILVDAHLQFVSFMFFQQIKMPSFLEFKDKVNFIFALIFMFLALIFAVAGFIILKYVYSKKIKHLKYVYPEAGPKINSHYLYIILTGSGRKFVLGFIQSQY